MHAPPSRGRHVAARALAALALLALASCLGGKRKGPPGKRKARIFTVHVKPVSERTLPDDIHASGTSQPRREVLLTTQVQGSVTHLKVALGRTVKAGELLARVSTVGLWGDARQASAELRRLKADLEQARQEQKDTQRLFDQKIASRQQLDDARYKVLRLEAQDAQARARLAQVGERYRGGTVIAPFDGIIAEQGVELGDYVTPGKVVGRLVDLAAVKVTVGLAEVDVVRIATATPVTVTFPALGERQYPGRVLAIAPTADKLSGAFPVEIEVANPGELRGGMAARAKFHRPGIPGIFVPAEAVVRRAGRPVAYVLSRDRASVEQRPCRLGISRDGLVQILAGLRVGEPLVVSGNTRLRPGSQVKVAGDPERPGGPGSQATAPDGAPAPRSRPTAVR